MIAKRAIICASGNSIRGNQKCPSNELEVWKKIDRELTISVNWGFKFFDPTLTIYGDLTFYNAESENLKKLQLVFGMQDDYYTRAKISKTLAKETFQLHNNIYLLPNRIVDQVDGMKNCYHGINAWEKGFYSRQLSGLLGLNLAIAFGCKIIYMLGFDCCAINGKTHFYEGEFKAEHKNESGTLETGVGLRTDGKYNSSVYNNKNIDEKFEPFKKELQQIKIYNVSPESRITVFPKITYEEFYEQLAYKTEWMSQDYMRKRIVELYEKKYL